MGHENSRFKKTINFDELYQKYNDKKWILTDPIQFVHRYSDPLDQELVGFLTSLFSYGSVPQIVKAVENILEPMGNKPAQFLKLTNISTGKEWKNFYYRFHKEEQLVILLSSLQLILREFGSLGNFFQKNHQGSLEKLLSKTSTWFWNEFAKNPLTQNTKFMTSMRFLINSPEQNSACKRQLMFLRWMVRSDAIDLGIWDWLEPVQLVVPLDTHMVAKSFELGLRKGPQKRAVNWKLALEVTDALRKINAKDPVKYDFSITRLGIIKTNKEKKSASFD